LIATGTAFSGIAGSVSAVLAGTQGLVKSGVGTLSLSGANRYSGGTTVLDGTLLLEGGNDRLSLEGDITSAGGVLDLGGNSQSTSGRIRLDGGIVQGGSLIATGSAFDAISGDIAAVLGGAQGLVKSGTGTLTLRGANTYAGGTTVVDGTLSLAGGDNRLFSGGSLTTLGGVLDLNGGSQSNSGRITFAGGLVRNGTLVSVGTAFAAQSGTVNAVLAGPLGLLKSGSGTLTLGGQSTYAGGTRVEDGVLILSGGDDRLPVAGDLTINGGTLDLGGQRQNTAGAVVFAGGVVENGTLTATGSSFDARAGTVSAVLSGTQGLVKSGTGVLRLSGSNSYSGGTVVNAGSLVLAGAGERLSSAGAITSNGGTLDFGGYSQTTSGDVIFAGGVVQNGTLTATGTWFDARSGVVNAVLSGSLGLNKSTSGALTLSGHNTLAAGISLFAGQLNLNASGDAFGSALGTGLFTIAGGSIANTSGALVTLNTNNQQAWNGDFTFAAGNDLNLGTGAVNLGGDVKVTVLAGTLTVGGVVDGAGFQLTKLGEGTLRLAGLSTYDGGTNVTAGELQLAAVQDTLSSSGSITISGGTLNLSGGSQTTSGVITFAGGEVKNGTLTAGASSFDGRSGLVSAVLAGTQALVKSGPGALTLGGDNTFSGGVLLQDGLLNLASKGNGLASPLGLGQLTITGGSLANTSGSLTTIATNNLQQWDGDFTFIGGSDLHLGSGAVTLGGDRIVTVLSRTLTVGGAIGGAGLGGHQERRGDARADGLQFLHGRHPGA
jgi:autotransporter-associated beta strand protein